MNKDKFTRFNSGNSSKLIRYLGKTRKPVHLLIINGNIYIKVFSKSRLLLSTDHDLSDCKILLDDEAMSWIRAYSRYPVDIEMSLFFIYKPDTVGFGYGSFGGHELSIIEQTV
jgi:hypothetical protein